MSATARGRLLALLAAVIAFVVYWLTLAHTITWLHDGADSGDLVGAAFIYGIPHPPGYPLYTLVGSLFAHIEGMEPAQGMAIFSRPSFEQQFKVPGLVAMRAVSGPDTVGMVLWYVQGEVAYYHLGAYSNEGYELGASFALFSRAIDIFAKTGIRWLDLGASAGLDGSAVDGLSRFKKGWSTGTRTAYLCGRIFDRVRYEELKAARGITQTNYFPAYRQGEFA